MLCIAKKLPIIIFIGIITSRTFAQTSNYTPRKIAPAALRSDFLLLRDTLQKVHTGLYRFRSKADMDHLFDSCFATIRDSMAVTDFYDLTSFVMAAIGHGHANIRLPKERLHNY